MHQNALIVCVPGVALLTQWMKKYIKIAENSPQNYHKKYEARFCNGKKRTPSTDLRNNIETRYFCCSRCCFAHAMDAKIVENCRKFTSQSSQKNMTPALAMFKTARRRFTDHLYTQIRLPDGYPKSCKITSKCI